MHFSDVLQHLVLRPEGLPAHVALVTRAKVLALHVPRHVLPPRALLMARAAPVDAGAAVPQNERVDARHGGVQGLSAGAGGSSRVHSELRGGGRGAAAPRPARVRHIVPEIVVQEEVA